MLCVHAGSAFLAFVGGTKPRRRLYGSLYKAPGDVKVCGGEGSGSLTQTGLAADVSVIPSLICVVFSFGTLVGGCASRAHLGEQRRFGCEVGSLEPLESDRVRRTERIVHRHNCGKMSKLGMFVADSFC